MWNEVVQLGNKSEVLVHGEPQENIAYREVFANKKSVRLSEFYQAQSAGMKPELVFEVRTVDFENDEFLTYEGKEYSIIRSYENGDITELTVTSYQGGD